MKASSSPRPRSWGYERKPERTVSTVSASRIGTKRIIVLIFLYLLAVPLCAQEGRLIPNPIRNIPRWVRNEFAAKDLGRQFTIIYRLYPYYLHGDFNGDGRRDYAIQIEEKSSRKDGIAIFHTKKVQSLATPVSIIGAGRSVDKLGDDLKWANVWAKIQPRDQTERGIPPLKGDVIKLEKREGNSGIVYWDGKKYAWKEIGNTSRKSKQ